MKIILSRQCLSLTGMLERGTGYFIQRRGDGFYSMRSKGYVPADGHWRFILLCAELCENGLFVTDIEVGRDEMIDALQEAGHNPSYWLSTVPSRDVYHAEDVEIINEFMKS